MIQVCWVWRNTAFPSWILQTYYKTVFLYVIEQCYWKLLSFLVLLALISWLLFCQWTVQIIWIAIGSLYFTFRRLRPSDRLHVCVKRFQTCILGSIDYASMVLLTEHCVVDIAARSWRLYPQFLSKLIQIDFVLTF